MSHEGSAVPHAFIHKRLERARQHVSSMWIPVNPNVLSKIQNGIAEGRYDLGYEFLVDDLKADLGLFFFCLRELSNLLQRENIPFSLSRPAELLNAAGYERIQSVLGIDPRNISRHSIDAINPAQAAQVQLALTSATATEMLVERSRGEGDFGFLSALLRQLGLTLVAWNYPTVFERAMGSITEQTDLDSTLSSMLGFSPVLLASSLVRTWGGSSELVYVVGGDLALSDLELARRETIHETVGDLAELCRVGESLARANDPEHYPTARTDWESARGELVRRLGNDALVQIRERLSDYCEAYRILQPELFARSSDLSPEKHIHEKSERDLLRSNRYVDLCPLALKRRLRDFYGWLPHSPSSRDAVSHFLRTVLPLTGFSAGCVYTLDAGTMELIPRLKFGEVKLRALTPLKYDGLALSKDSVLGAYHAPAPFVSRTDDSEHAFVVGVLGDERKMGVLYFELPAQALDSDEFDYLNIFKAIRQVFHDCLGIS